ncbi:MAG: hypothetical protein RLZZ336_2100 [Cyanobacteriota bacterium]
MNTVARHGTALILLGATTLPWAALAETPSSRSLLSGPELRMQLAQNPRMPIEGAAEDLPAQDSKGNQSIDQSDSEAVDGADNKQAGPYLPNPFNLPIPRDRGPYDYSHKIHCDVLRHLKVPATWRRLDTYMRPMYILPRGNVDSLSTRDQLLASKGREQLYESGVDIYGCSAVDYLIDVQSNLSSNPLVRGTQGPWHNWQMNFMQIVGVDLYSRLINKNYKGGQIHVSFTYPEAANGGPIYSYGNTLNPAGLGTRQYHGYFYTDTGRSREVNPLMQGVRIFEYWMEHHYGRYNQSYVRLGAINPWITFNKSIVSGLFGFWAFNEPGVIGTTPSTANGPLVTTAPPGLSLENTVGDNLILKAMAVSGYWDPSGGIDNRRGYNQYWDFNTYGVELLYEATWRGGTYSLNPNDNGNPWFIRLGGQYHTGYGLSNLYDVNGGYFFLPPFAERQQYWGNSQYYAMIEAMVYREPGSYNRGLTAFLKGKWSPWQFKGSTTKGVYGGLAYEGIFGRNNDIFFAGWAMPFVNQGVLMRSQAQTACTALPNCSVSPWQGTLEVGYSAQITPYLFFTPKLWWVVYPNVRRDLGDIVSAGFELRLSF